MRQASISSRLMLSIGAAFAMLAIALAAMSLNQFRVYHSNVQVDRARAFATRVAETNQDLWGEYLAAPGLFGTKLRSFILFEPNTGLYLLDPQGRVLATAGEGRIYWSSLRIDLSTLRAALADGSASGVVGADPDTVEGSCYVSGQPLLQNGKEVGWIYVVARNADQPLPDQFGKFALRAAATLILLVLAAATLIAYVIRRQVTKPLASLTQAAENVRTTGFTLQTNHATVPETQRNDEIGQLARSFSAMLQKLTAESKLVQETDRQRRDMVQSISHDVRTPLTALMGHLETIKLKQDMANDEKLRYVNAAFRNAKQLQGLTESLAELAALDAPDSSAHKELTDLGDLVSDVAQGFDSRAHDAGVEIRCSYPDCSPILQLDARLIERALNNLIENAVRVTPSGGVIDLRVVCTEHTVSIQVEDSGSGIDPKDHERIFERFVQGQVERSRRGSSGLGLAIVRRVAQLHGGNARVAPEKAHGLGGACFELSLPC